MPTLKSLELFNLYLIVCSSSGTFPDKLSVQFSITLSSDNGEMERNGASFLLFSYGSVFVDGSNEIITPKVH